MPGVSFGEFTIYQIFFFYFLEEEPDKQESSQIATNNNPCQSGFRVHC